MTDAARPWCWLRRRGPALAVFALFALAAWLDSAASGLALPLDAPVHTAAVVGIIVGVLGSMASVLATTAQIAIVWLARAVSWIAARLVTLFVSTGAIFAKVWEGIKIAWLDVLKPTLLWVNTKLTSLYSWLKNTFKPVFDFLQDVQKRINGFYTTFVKPVVDIIDFIRAINRALLAFHITVLQDLDALLQQLEARINEPFLWVNQKLNQIVGVLETIVTANGFFQQVTLIRSMSRYAPAWMNGFWNRQSDPTITARSPIADGRRYPAEGAWVNGQELTHFYQGEPNRMTEHVAYLLPLWRQSAGIDPPIPFPG